jgi:hypothetical protein
MVHLGAGVKSRPEASGFAFLDPNPDRQTARMHHPGWCVGGGHLYLASQPDCERALVSRGVTVSPLPNRRRLIFVL